MGLRAVIAIYLSRISLAKTDHADPIIGFSETQHMQTGVKEAERNIPNLAVLAPLGGAYKGGSEIKVHCTLKGKATVGDVSGVLVRIEGDVYEPNCIYKIRIMQRESVELVPGRARPAHTLHVLVP